MAHKAMLLDRRVPSGRIGVGRTTVSLLLTIVPLFVAFALAFAILDFSYKDPLRAGVYVFYVILMAISTQLMLLGAWIAADYVHWRFLRIATGPLRISYPAYALAGLLTLAFLAFPWTPLGSAPTSTWDLAFWAFFILLPTAIFWSTRRARWLPGTLGARLALARLARDIERLNADITAAQEAARNQASPGTAS